MAQTMQSNLARDDNDVVVVVAPVFSQVVISLSSADD
jgi:hypothetical protein